MRAALSALCVVVGSAQAQPPAPKPTEAECRAFLELRGAQESYDEARNRYHAARLRCANPLSLVMIARTYEEQGDLPRALAYIEEFLVAADQAHESRAAIEKAAAALRERVPAAQRVSIAAELSTEPAKPPEPAKSATATAPETARARLTGQVEDFDGPSRSSLQKIERASGFFVGANLAYATMAKVEVRTDTMNGKADFPSGLLPRSRPDTASSRF